MEFLINNPVIAFALLVVIGFAAVILTKIIEEVGLNKALSLKQKQMRISSPVKGFKSRIAFLSSAALAPVAVVVIMFAVGLNPNMTTSGNLVDVKSSDDVLSLYSTFQERMNNDYYTFDWGLRTFGALEESVQDMELDGEPTPNAGSDDYSETNNQVVGVDEMDNVLTDGLYIYSMYQNKIQITLAYTIADGPEVLSLYRTIEYPSDYCDDEQFYPQGMYVDDDYLVVIGNQYSYNCDDNYYGEGDVEGDYFYPYWYAQSSSIKVLVYDKTEDFELKDEYTMNGYFTGTRKIGSDLYIVTNNYIPFYLEDVNIDDYLSQYEVNGQVTKAAYEDIIYIEGTSPNSFTTFYGIDLDTTEVDMESVLGDSGYNLYVSPENMYLVGSVYYFLPMVDFIELEQPVYESKTAILKIEIDAGEVEYSGSGFVAGYTLNQFSMDEYNGYLRVTTTTGSWGDSINNRLFILDEDLNTVGMVEHLGKPGETIKSTRFSGDYAYVVTFEQTDPFYVIDVSDPTNPVVDGELLIPGFSTYLQPLNDDFMLGIGFGDNDGGTQGLKISIYDVSDKTNPVIFDEIIFDYSEFGWASSTVTYNHKDLLVSLSKGIIALPFSTYGYDHVNNNYSYNSGILVYNIDLVTGFDFNGFVTHDVDSSEDVYVYKSKFIDNYFYTVSNKYIKVSTIEDTETILYSTDLN